MGESINTLITRVTFSSKKAKGGSRGSSTTATITLSKGEGEGSTAGRKRKSKKDQDSSSHQIELTSKYKNEQDMRKGLEKLAHGYMERLEESVKEWFPADAKFRLFSSITPHCIPAENTAAAWSELGGEAKFAQLADHYGQDHEVTYVLPEVDLGRLSVGDRVEMYWEADQVWYDAEIANSKVAHLENGGYAVSYEVHYDDDGE